MGGGGRGIKRGRTWGSDQKRKRNRENRKYTKEVAMAFLRGQASLWNFGTGSNSMWVIDMPSDWVFPQGDRGRVYLRLRRRQGVAPTETEAGCSSYRDGGRV